MENPKVLAEAKLDKTWGNVAEGISGFLVSSMVTPADVSPQLAVYAACAIEIMFLRGGWRVTSEDTAADATVVVAWGVQRIAIAGLRDLFIHALRAWPSAYCHPARNAFPQVLADAFETAEATRGERRIAPIAAVVLYKLLEEFDVPNERTKALIFDLAEIGRGHFDFK